MTVNPRTLGGRTVTPLVAMLVAAVVALASVGCQASPTPQATEPPQSPADTTAAASSPVVVPDHLVLSREAYHLMEEAGDRAWPGWGEAVPPVVVILGDRHHVLGTPPTDGDWEQVAPGEWVGPPIEGVGPGVQMADRTPFAAMPAVEELQQLIDQVVGIGRITLDPPRYLRFVVHEAFHAFQIAALDGELPDFGLTGDERELLPELAEAEIATGVALEALVLADGLRAETDGDAVTAAREFLDLRAERRTMMSEDAIALERALEWTEGLARYADIALTEAAAEGYDPTLGFAALATYPPRGAAAEEHLDWLNDLSEVPGTVRDRYYEVGAGEARLLDRLMPGWHSRALPDAEALESLLAEAVEGAEAGLAPTLRALEARIISVAGTRLEVAVADRPAFWSSGLAGVETLAPLEGVLFAFPEPMDVAFTNRGMAFALDVTFFDSQGTYVDAVVMPACPDEPCDAFRAGGAFRYALEVPSGSASAFSPGDRLDPGEDGDAG